MRPSLRAGSKPRTPWRRSPVGSNYAAEVEKSANPKATAADVVAALAEKGITVTAGLVYINKGKMKQAKVHRLRKARRVVRAGQKTGSTNPVALIIRVKELAMEAGGMQNLKSLIGVLAE